MRIRIETRKLLQTYRATVLRLYHQTQPNLVRGLSVVAVAVLGAFLLHISHAAAPNTAPEAESGTLADGASMIADTNASGGQGVIFGSITPGNLEAFTGGNNIALVWDMPDVAVQSVQVWRNNTQIATVAPSSNVSIQNQQLGKEYDDNSVSAGSTYQYKVRAVLANGTMSAFTPTVTATQPTNSMPVPTITVDPTNAPAALVSYVQTYIVPLLKTWYPKDADELAYPSYTPPTNLTINFTSDVSAAGDYCYTSASGSTGTISCDPDLVNADITKPNNDVAAVFVHESTHAIQSAFAGPSWTVEGGASWASDFYARQNINPYIPRAGDQLGGYTPGAFFIEFMRENYSENFPRDMTVALHNNTYSDNIISQDTGGKLTSSTQAWQAAINAYNSSVDTIQGIDGKCVEVQNGTVNAGTKLVLDDCNTHARLVTHATFQSGVSGKCLDNYAGNGTRAEMWDCNGVDQMWTVTDSGLVKSENGGTCLTVSGDGVTATLSACKGGTSQQWTVGGNLIKNTASGLCLTDPGSSTANNTETTVATCSGAANQRWTPTGQTTVFGTYSAQQWALTYRTMAKKGYFDITSPTLANVLGTDYCIDGTGSVLYWQCLGSKVQHWQYDASSKNILNVSSGKCLSTDNGGSGNGTQLVIRTCDGGTDQQWTVPAAS